MDFMSSGCGFFRVNFMRKRVRSRTIVLAHAFHSLIERCSSGHGFSSRSIYIEYWYMNRPPVSITLWFLSWYILLNYILGGFSSHMVSIPPDCFLWRDFSMKSMWEKDVLGVLQKKARSLLLFMHMAVAKWLH